MKRKTLLSFYSFAIIIVLLFFTSCNKNKEELTLDKKLQQVIFEHESKETSLDSVSIISIDSLTHYGYVKIILEQLENMEYEYSLFGEYSDDLSSAEQMEIEMTLQEIGGMIEYLQYKTEENTDNNDFFCYFVLAKLWNKQEENSIYYLITPDFIIRDDPFSDNLID